MAGRWWIVGFATNAQWFVSHKADMKMGTSVMLPTARGDLDLTYTNLKSVCERAHCVRRCVFVSIELVSH